MKINLFKRILNNYEWNKKYEIFTPQYIHNLCSQYVVYKNLVSEQH